MVCGCAGVGALGLAGILGTLTLRSCDMLGDGTLGFDGFREANADIDGFMGVCLASDVTCVVNGNIQTKATTAVHATAAGIQNLERVRESATLA